MRILNLKIGIINVINLMKNRSCCYMNKCIDCKLKRICKYKDTIEEITKETSSVITFDCSYRTTVEDKDKKQKSSCSGKCGECQGSCKTTSKKVETKNNINKTNKDNQTKDNKNQTKDNKNSKEIDLVEFLNELNALFK